MLCDILLTTDCGDVSALVLLDMTAAFDLSVIRCYCSGSSECLVLATLPIDGLSHTYLDVNSMFGMILPGHLLLNLVCSMPQGSVAVLIKSVESHALFPHLYAYDIAVYGSCLLAAVEALSAKISDCAVDIAYWKRLNRLMLNLDKSEAICCTTSRRQHQLPVSTILIISIPITPARSVCDLGIYTDVDMSHVK